VIFRAFATQGILKNQYFFSKIMAMSRLIKKIKQYDDGGVLLTQYFTMTIVSRLNVFIISCPTGGMVDKNRRSFPVYFNSQWSFVHFLPFFMTSVSVAR